MKKITPKISAAKEAMPLLLDEKQASTYLGVSLSFLRKGRSEGAPGGRTQPPPFVAIGRRKYYRRTDLVIWAENLTATRTSA